MARFGRVDLDDREIGGGTMNGWWIGVNWWAREHWRAGIAYGNVDLERFGLLRALSQFEITRSRPSRLSAIGRYPVA